MKRFTERRGDGVRYIEGRYEITCYPKNDNLSDIDKMAVRLCELEDKIESGQLVELPKLYQLSVGCKGTSLENYFIDEISPKITKINDKWNLEYKDRLCGNGGRKLIGYFDGMKEAEARLKELQEK